MAKIGFYTVHNTKKYNKPNKTLKYKSSWELQFMIYCDNSKKIKQWNYESVRIPYIFNKKRHFYYPDFWIQTYENDKLIIEIKPKHQTLPPKNPKSKGYQRELIRFTKNCAKWHYAQKYTSKKNMNFLIVTEKLIKKIKNVNF